MTSPPRKTKPRRIGEILVEMGALGEGRLRAALAYQKQWGGRLGCILVEERMIRETDLVRALSSQLNIPMCDLESIQFSGEMLGLLPPELIRKHDVLPLRRQGRFLDVALSDQTDLNILENVSALTGLDVHPFLAGRSDIRAVIDRHLRRRVRALTLPGVEVPDLGISRGMSQYGVTPPVRPTWESHPDSPADRLKDPASEEPDRDEDSEPLSLSGLMDASGLSDEAPDPVPPLLSSSALRELPVEILEARTREARASSQSVEPSSSARNTVPEDDPTVPVLRRPRGDTSSPAVRPKSQKERVSAHTRAREEPPPAEDPGGDAVDWNDVTLTDVPREEIPSRAPPRGRDR